MSLNNSSSSVCWVLIRSNSLSTLEEEQGVWSQVVRVGQWGGEGRGQWEGGVWSMGRERV